VPNDVEASFYAAESAHSVVSNAEQVSKAATLSESKSLQLAPWRHLQKILCQM
jgi:hypothetical protein